MYNTCNINVSLMNGIDINNVPEPEPEFENVAHDSQDEVSGVVWVGPK